MTEGRRLILLEHKVPRPCESISDGHPEKGPPRVSHSKRCDDDRDPEPRSAGMHQSVRRTTVLLHVEAEEIVVISKLLRLCHARHRSAARRRVPARRMGGLKPVNSRDKLASTKRWMSHPRQGCY